MQIIIKGNKYPKLKTGKIGVLGAGTSLTIQILDGDDDLINSLRVVAYTSRKRDPMITAQTRSTSEKPR